MTGKILAGLIIVIALAAGAAIYYLQIHAFYEPVQVRGEGDVMLTSLVSGEPEAVLSEDFQAIDAWSSPLRYRACFTTPMSHAMLTETYEMRDAVPRVAPPWFDCFDADALATEIDEGTALVFLGEKNIAYGVDRVVAITDDGRGYVWHDLNNCGKKSFDGTVVGEECPPLEGSE